MQKEETPSTKTIELINCCTPIEMNSKKEAIPKTEEIESQRDAHLWTVPDKTSQLSSLTFSNIILLLSIQMTQNTIIIAHLPRIKLEFKVKTR